MRRDLAVLGGALVVLGAVVAASPGIDAALSGPVTPNVLAILGLVVALVGAALTAGPSRATADGSPSTDDNLLGAEFDATLARVERMSSPELRTDDAPEELRERLREATVAVVASREGVDRETAAAHVERGEWTDDPLAAAFLSDSLRAPPATRFRERWSTTPPVVARTRRTVAALEGEL